MACPWLRSCVLLLLLKQLPIANGCPLESVGIRGHSIGHALAIHRTNIMINVTDKPLAAEGLTSYRYPGPYGFIMIGARSHTEALSEAVRSLGDKREAPTLGKLQVWAGTSYVGAAA